MAKRVVGHAGDVGVVADDVTDRPGADRRQLRVAEPQLAVYVGVREKVPEGGRADVAVALCMIGTFPVLNPIDSHK